jgi:hypothetical protein
VPFDQQVLEAEMHGETPLKYKESVSMRAISELCMKLV